MKKVVTNQVIIFSNNKMTTKKRYSITASPNIKYD